MPDSDSILDSTKKILGIADDDNSFDMDVITHINAVFSVLNEMGVGPDDTYGIDDDSNTWNDLGLPANQKQVVRTYMYLKVRAIFDPPTTSFQIDATNNQILEYETRLHYMREDLIPVPVNNDEGGESDADFLARLEADFG